MTEMSMEFLQRGDVWYSLFPHDGGGIPVENIRFQFPLQFNEAPTIAASHYASVDILLRRFLLRDVAHLCVSYIRYLS